MHYTDGIVNLRAALGETVAELTGTPRRYVDELREAHERINVPPGELARIVSESSFIRRSVANPDGSRGHLWEKADAASVNVDEALGLLLDKLEDRLERTTPECLPLPDRRGLSALTAAKNLRLHLERTLTTRHAHPAFRRRMLAWAKERLATLDDFGAYVESCRAAGTPAHANALAMLADARRWLQDAGFPLPPDPTPETLEESVRVHREHVGTLQARMEREAPASTETAQPGPATLTPARAPGERRTRPVQIGDAAEWFRCSPDKLRGMIRRGEVGAERPGGPESRTWVFDLDEVVRANPDADADADPQLAGMGRRRNARH
jgi:hypothetical protein